MLAWFGRISLPLGLMMQNYKKEMNTAYFLLEKGQKQ